MCVCVCVGRAEHYPHVLAAGSYQHFLDGECATYIFAIICILSYLNVYFIRKMFG